MRAGLSPVRPESPISGDLGPWGSGKNKPKQASAIFGDYWDF
jgi:hypothetical protein